MILNTSYPFSTGTLAPPAGDGVLLRVVRDGHVSGLHGGGAPRARHRPPTGRPGAAQGGAEGPAGRHPWQVGPPRARLKCTPGFRPTLIEGF